MVKSGRLASSGGGKWPPLNTRPVLMMNNGPSAHLSAHLVTRESFLTRGCFRNWRFWNMALINRLPDSTWFAYTPWNFLVGFYLHAVSHMFLSRMWSSAIGCDWIRFKLMRSSGLSVSVCVPGADDEAMPSGADWVLARRRDCCNAIGRWAVTSRCARSRARGRPRHLSPVSVSIFFIGRYASSWLYFGFLAFWSIFNAAYFSLPTIICFFVFLVLLPM